jgi:tRNA G18 (ribose-2'-O)-methylase SpoU
VWNFVNIIMENKLIIRSFDSQITPEEFAKTLRKPVSAVLDNLRSAFNVGSIIRTADCACIEMVYFCGITAYPPHKKLEKTSVGALPYVPNEHYENIIDVLNKLKDRKVTIVALETTNKSRTIWNYQFPERVALILGNEALGVSEKALDMSDEIVEIPMLGYKNSINVAVAFGIAVYEIQRQHLEKMSSIDRRY